MTDEPLDPATQEVEAIRRLALLYDGKLLHRYLRRVLETVILTPDPGALQMHNGRRTLARDLMALMAEGIESGGSGHSSGTGNDPVLVRGAKPVDVTGARGVRRRGNARAIADGIVGPGSDADPGPRSG